jgi:hypothetical protein
MLTRGVCESGNHGYAACITTATPIIGGFIILPDLGGIYTAVPHLMGKMIKFALHPVIKSLAVLLRNRLKRMQLWICRIQQFVTFTFNFFR